MKYKMSGAEQKELETSSTQSQYTQAQEQSKKKIDSTVEEIDLSFSQEKSENPNFKWYDYAGATIISGVRTLVNSRLLLYEKIVDGGAWFGGTVASGIKRLMGDEAGAKEIEQKVMDFTAKEYVMDSERNFYENTDLGKYVNAASAIKYDAEKTKKVEDTLANVELILAAVAVGIVTGGASVPVTVAAYGGTFGVGFLSGAGQTAQNSFQDVENRNYWRDSFDIGLDGALKGVELVSYARTGGSLYSGLKGFAGMNVREIFQLLKSKLSKEGIKSFAKTLSKNLGSVSKTAALKTLLDVDVYTDTLGLWADDIKNGVKTGDWDKVKMSLEAGYVIATNFFSHIPEAVLNISTPSSTSTPKVPETRTRYHYGDYTKKYNEFMEAARQLDANPNDAAALKKYNDFLSEIEEQNSRLDRAIKYLDDVDEGTDELNQLSEVNKILDGSDDIDSATQPKKEVMSPLERVRAEERAARKQAKTDAKVARAEERAANRQARVDAKAQSKAAKSSSSTGGNSDLVSYNPDGSVRINSEVAQRKANELINEYYQDAEKARTGGSSSAESFISDLEGRLHSMQNAPGAQKADQVASDQARRMLEEIKNSKRSN